MAVAAVALTVAGRDDQQLVVAATDEWSRRLQTLEMALGEGPGVDAEQGGGPVLVTDLDAFRPAARWPLYHAGAAESPYRAQYAFALHVGAIRLGVLTLYRERAGPLEEPELATALLHAEAATILLLHLQDVSDDGVGLHADLDISFGSAAELHQATGMIAVQAGVSMSEALLLLRGHAFGADRSPLDVANDVLTRTLHFREEKES
jgi:hypothetical protein